MNTQKNLAAFLVGTVLFSSCLMVAMAAASAETPPLDQARIYSDLAKPNLKVVVPGQVSFRHWQGTVSTAALLQLTKGPDGHAPTVVEQYGQVQMHLLKGRLRVLFDKQELLLKSGDVASWGNLQHRIACEADECLLSIISTPMAWERLGAEDGAPVPLYMDPEYLKKAGYRIDKDHLHKISTVDSGAQFMSAFDKSKMKPVAPDTLMSQIAGRKLGVEAWLVAGGAAPFSQAKSHHHPEEHVWMQLAGDATHYAVEFNDGKTREYDGGAGLVMHMPAGQQHTGGHGKEDAYMVTVSIPSVLTAVASRASGVETRDHYDAFDFNTASLVESEKDWVYTRKGKLGDGLGEEAILLKKAIKKDYIVSARKAPAEEVAIVYQGHVKVTGCGEARILGPGDVFYCPGALMYTGLGQDDARVVRVFTPADAKSFVSKY